MKLEIEVDGPQNECLSFRPLQRRIRGRFDHARCANPMAATKVREWGGPIPGQRLGIDSKSGEAWLHDPLHDAEFATIRDRIEAHGMAVPDDETFQNVDVPTWLFWLRRACESGVARVTEGTLPETIDGPIQRSFISKPVVDSRDRLIEKLIGIVYASLPDGKRKEVAELIGA